MPATLVQAHVHVLYDDVYVCGCMCFTSVMFALSLGASGV